MTPNDQLTIIRNRHRAHDLRRFREKVELYFERAEYDEDDLLMDWEGARAARAQINRLLPRIIQIVKAVGPAHEEPGAIDVLESIFNSRYQDGACQEILDIVDKALGVYEASFYNALARTLNPFHYIGLLLGFIFSLPSRLFGVLGFGRRKREIAGQEMGATASLASIEKLIERRFAEMRDWQTQNINDSNGQMTDLAERLDFTERVLAQQRPINRLGAPESERVVTPV
jgi:hypothetical protein